MKPNASPLTQLHACRCGGAHPAIARLFGVFVLVCPEVGDDALHFVQQTKATPAHMVTGVSAAPETGRLEDLERRVAALEQNLLYATPPRRVPKAKTLEAR